MPILIDGHNLIGRMPALSLADPDDERQLVMLLLAYSSRARKPMTVVFDPGGAFALSETQRHGRVEVVFARHGSNADQVIVRRVRRSRDPAGITVVTSDRELASQAHSYGAKVKSAEDFAAEMSALAEDGSEGSDTPLSAAELEAWLALFERRNGANALG